jgi:hypothetical protein
MLATTDDSDDAMSRTIRIAVLVENTAQGAGILAEHGLAYWIEWPGHKVLFDTGQGNVLASNAYRMNIPLHEADAVVLSHGHYDHTGGLAEALKTNRLATVYAHKAAFAPKYARKTDGSSREIGIPHTGERALRLPHGRLVYTEQPTPVADRLTVTGPVPRLTDFEDTGGPFFLDPACTRPETWPARACRQSRARRALLARFPGEAALRPSVFSPCPASTSGAGPFSSGRTPNGTRLAYASVDSGPLIPNLGTAHGSSALTLEEKTP